MDSDLTSQTSEPSLETPLSSSSKMSLRNKTWIIVSLVGIGSGILSSFVSPIIAGLVALFIFPSKPGDELGGIVSLFIVIPAVWLVFAIFASYISFRLTHKWKYLFLGLLLHILTIAVFYVVVYFFYKVDERERLENYKQEPNQTQLLERGSQ